MDSINTKIDRANNVVVQKVTGQLCLNDIISKIESALGDITYVAGMDCIWDVTEANLSQVQVDDIFILIKFVSNNLLRTGTGFKLAIIANSDLGYGLAKMFIGYGQVLPFSKNVFRSYDDGLAWISETKRDSGEVLLQKPESSGLRQGFQQKCKPSSFQ